jgi:hypothetical protein
MIDRRRATNHNDVALAVFYAHDSHNPNHDSLVKHVFCHVSYHSKTPSFQDEIKVALPFDLSRDHVFLFTFFQVHVCKKLAVGKAPMDVIGHAELPVLTLAKENHGGETVGVIVPDSPAHTLVVTTHVPYHEQIVAPLGRGGYTMTFQCRSRLLSSVYSQDGSIQAFFDASKVAMTKEVRIQSTVHLDRIADVYHDCLFDMVGPCAAHFRLTRRLEFYAAIPYLATDAAITLVSLSRE